MADVADSVIRRTRVPCIIGAVDIIRKYHFGTRKGLAKFSICGSGNIFVDHINVCVAVGIVAVPAELAALPDAVAHILRIVLVSEMHRGGLRLHGCYETGAGIKAEFVFFACMAGAALAVTVVVMALEADTHHHILVFDIGLLLCGPDARARVMPGLVGCVACRHARGLPICIQGMVLRKRRIGDTRQLRGEGFGRIMAAEAFAVDSLHMTIYTFLFEAVPELLVLPQPERIRGVFMQDIIVMAIPARVSGEVRRWISRDRVRTGGRRPAMTGSRPFGEIDLCLRPIESIEIIHIRFGRPVAIEANDSRIDRPSPLGVLAAAVASGIGAGLGDFVVCPAILEDYILLFVHVICRINMRGFAHASGRKPVYMTIGASAVLNCCIMTLVAREVGLQMTRMRVRPCSTRTLVGEHRHGFLPLLTRWPACPAVCVAVSA